MSGNELMTVPQSTPRAVDSTQARRARQGRDVGRRRAESVTIFAVAATCYVLLGNWLISQIHLVGFETLEHVNRAVMLWHNDPPKLASIGVDGPPLLTAVLAPVTIVAPWASSLAIVPVVSAFAMAGVLVVANTLMRRCGLQLAMRVPILVVVGINPMWLYHASGGRPDTVASLLLVAALGSLLAWYVTADIRFVLGAGTLLGIMFLGSYSALLWAVPAAVMVAAVLARARATGDEIEGTLIGFGMPLAYLSAGWLVLVTIAVGNPVDLVERSSAPAPLLGSVLADTLALVAAASPLTFVVLPALIVAAVRHKDIPSWFLAAALLIAALLPAAEALARTTEEPFAHHEGLRLFMVTLVGAVWALSALSLSRGPAVLALIALLLAGVPWTWQQMQTYPHQRTEANFIDGLRTQRSQEGRESRSGGRVGIDSEIAMANYLKDNLAEPSSVLTDDAQTYSVMLLTGRPWLFLDRVDHGDAAWFKERENPGPGVTHVLISTHPDDLIAEAYPDWLTQDSRAVVFRTDRYLLIELDRSTSADSGAMPEPIEGEQ